MLVACPISSHAKDVTLSWDASPTPTVSGYNVLTSLHPSIADPMVTDVGNVLTTTLNGLGDTDEHWFCVTAYDGQGRESTCSNIVHSPAIPETVLPSLDFDVNVEILQ